MGRVPRGASEATAIAATIGAIIVAFMGYLPGQRGVAYWLWTGGLLRLYAGALIGMLVMEMRRGRLW